MSEATVGGRRKATLSHGGQELPVSHEIDLVSGRYRIEHHPGAVSLYLLDDDPAVTDSEKDSALHRGASVRAPEGEGLGSVSRYWRTVFSIYLALCAIVLVACGAIIGTIELVQLIDRQNWGFPIAVSDGVWAVLGVGGALFLFSMCMAWDWEW